MSTSNHKKFTEHFHYWEQKYTTINGVDSFSGLECECGLLLTVDAISTVINYQANSLSVLLETIRQENEHE